MEIYKQKKKEERMNREQDRERRMEKTFYFC